MDAEAEVYDPEAIPRSDDVVLEGIDRLGLGEDANARIELSAPGEVVPTPAAWRTCSVDVGPAGADAVRRALQRIMLSTSTHIIPCCRSGPESTVWVFQALATTQSNAVSVEEKLHGMQASFAHDASDPNISNAATASDAGAADYIEDEHAYIRKDTIASTCVHVRFARSDLEPTPFLIPEISSGWFNFQLDEMQKHAVGCVHIGESCLVSAHTSAGKTAVAEYAIRQSLDRCKRIIYTSPLKALSNQKYADFSKAFSDGVGLMTGDITIAQDADILVMTTEILHSMLFRLIDDAASFDKCEWVIFDEAQYLADDERGYCWEECIILLPDHVRVLLLSATTPNSDQLASWIASVRFEPVHSVQTDWRPVPLRHRIFRCGLTQSRYSFVQKRTDSFYDVHTRSGMLKEAELAQIVRPDFIKPLKLFITSSLIGSLQFSLQVFQAQLEQEAEGEYHVCFPSVTFVYDGMRARRHVQAGLVYEVHIDDTLELSFLGLDDASFLPVGSRVRQHIFSWLAQKVDNAAPGVHYDSDEGDDFDDFEKMFCLLRDWRKFPLIAFCFSRSETEHLAIGLSGRRKMDLTSPEEKVQIESILSDKLRNCESFHLDQVEHAKALLRRGFGVHHGGIFPFLRDITETLFLASLVKVVFATETFSVGINMPARTVVFCGLSKFDGKGGRLLTAGEYKQMSGRAGRRGIDDEGDSIVMVGRRSVRKHSSQRAECDNLLDMYSPRVGDVLSSFALRWNTLVNLMRLGPAHLNMMLSKSFMAASKPKESMDKSKTGCFSMVRALQKLNVLDGNYAVLPKGAMVQFLITPFDPVLFVECATSCQMPSVAFSHLSPLHIVAVCSAFVSEGRPTRDSDGILVFPKDLPDAVQAALLSCDEIATNLHSTLKACGCSYDVCSQLVFKHNLNTRFSLAVLLWAGGADFPSVVRAVSWGTTTISDIGGEGALIRMLMRVDEFLREFATMLRRCLGFHALASELQQIRQNFKRGVLAIPSLYVGRLGEEEMPAVEPVLRGPPPGPANVSPLDIGFSHSSISAVFRDGRTILATVNELLQSLSDGVLMHIPLRVFWFHGRLYTLGNRRLAAYRLAHLAANIPIKISVEVVPEDIAWDWGWHRKFTTGFTAGRKARVRNTGQDVGFSRPTTTYGAFLWQPPVEA